MSKVKPVPQGYRTAMPYLIIDGAAKALDFYKRIFGAVEKMRMPSPGGKVGHAEITIGDSIIMLADEYPDMNWLSPQTIGGTPVTIMIYVEDVDAFCNRATAAGATVRRPLADQFYGDRSCTLTDPFGHTWTFATHKEDVSPEEMQRRAAALFGQK